MIYDEADKALRYMNRQNLRYFGKLKLAKWDSINLVSIVSQTYNDSVQMVRQQYRKVGFKAMMDAMKEADWNIAVAEEIAEDTITSAWIEGFLNDVDDVALYAFLPETERKKQRLIEALSVAHNRNYEIDKALRYWTVQIGQFAISVVDETRLEGFRKAGIERVMWVTQRDERVCEECMALDGKVFDIDKVPPKPHWGDRCYLVPA